VGTKLGQIYAKHFHHPRQVVSWNVAAERIFGYLSSEILGQPLTRIIQERYRDAHRTGLVRVNTDGDLPVIGETIELAGQRKEGTEFPVEISLSIAAYMVARSREIAGSSPCTG
jgi:PAS domain S-box-containing protein